MLLLHDFLYLVFFNGLVDYLTSLICLGKCIASLCWRPDGKAIAVGLEDGTISLHDVEVIGILFFSFFYVPMFLTS